MQMAEGVKMHYREMLPLTNASDSFLKEFEELQSEVSNPVCALKFKFKTVISKRTREVGGQGMFLQLKSPSMYFNSPLPFTLRLSCSVVEWNRATRTGATTSRYTACAMKIPLIHVWVWLLLNFSTKPLCIKADLLFNVVLTCKTKGTLKM